MVRVREQNDGSGMPPWVGLWILFFLLVWQILLWAQNPGLMSDDSGEMAAAAWNLGLPHPPGYPLVSLLGHLFTWIPLGSPAYRFNLLSQTMTMASLGLVLTSCRLLVKSSGDPWFEGILAALGIVFISYRSLFAQSLTAKGAVYTLTLLLCAAMVHLWLKQEEKPKKLSWVALAWFLWALGMSNHWQTQILWLPFLLFWVVRPAGKIQLKNIILFMTLSVVGFSLYLYLPLRTLFSPQPCWGNPINVKGFVWVVSRQLTAGDESWIRGGHLYWGHLKEIVKIFALYWIPGFGLLAAAGLMALSRKKKLFFSAVLFLLLPTLLSVADFTLHDPHLLYLVNVYLVSTAGIVLLLGWYGLAAINGKARKVFFFIISIGAALWLVHVFGLEDKSRYTLAEDFGSNVLKGLPRGSVLLAEGDHYVFPIFYQKYVLGQRQDLVFEPAVFLVHDWGWRQLAAQGRAEAKIVKETPITRERIERLAREGARKGTGLFCSLQRTKWEGVFDSFGGSWVPEGLVFRWEASRPGARKSFEEIRGKAASQRLRGIAEFKSSRGLDFSSNEIYLYYADQFFIPAESFGADEDGDGRFWLFEKGLAFEDPPNIYNNLAVAAGRMGFPSVARRFCLLAIQKDRGYLPSYINLANAFLLEGDYQRAIQTYEQIRALSGDGGEWNNKILKTRQFQALGIKPAVGPKTQAEYEALEKRWGGKGLSFLAAIVRQTALEEKEPKP